MPPPFVNCDYWMLWTNNQTKWESRTRELTRKLIENGNGEVLILPGDFSEWNQQSLWILDEAARHYRIYDTGKPTQDLSPSLDVG